MKIHLNLSALKIGTILRTLFIARSFQANSIFILIAITILTVTSINAQVSCEWPCFHGIDRSNKSEETGLMTEWTENNPRLLLTVSGLGDGYSSVSIGGDHIYTAGIYNDQTYVFAFDLNGRPVWKSSNGKSWSTNLSWASTYIGPRSTPTYDNGKVYHLSERGRLTSYDSKTGKEVWTTDLTTSFDAAIPEYGYSESVLIDGDRLHVRPAGKKGFQVCLNKNTGETIWTNNEIPGLEGYSSMVILERGGFRQIIGSSSNSYYGLDSETGKLLWKVDFSNQRELNNTDAIVKNEYVFLTSGYGKGCMLLKLRPVGKGFITETVWESNLMDNHHGGVILHEGFLFGSGSNSRGWYCIDFLTGKQMWKAEGKGSLTFAGGMLYILDEKGTMKLVKAIPEKYEIKGEFKVPKGGESMFWAHPVVCGGRLYIRHADKLFVYDIRNKLKS